MLAPGAKQEPECSYTWYHANHALALVARTTHDPRVGTPQSLIDDPAISNPKKKPAGLFSTYGLLHWAIRKR